MLRRPRRSHLEWPGGRGDGSQHLGQLCPPLHRLLGLPRAPLLSEPCPFLHPHRAPNPAHGRLAPVRSASLSYSCGSGSCLQTPARSLTSSSLAPVPSTQAGCPLGKRNSLLSWLSGNVACARSPHCHLPAELRTAPTLTLPPGTWAFHLDTLGGQPGTGSSWPSVQSVVALPPSSKGSLDLEKAPPEKPLGQARVHCLETAKPAAPHPAPSRVVSSYGLRHCRLPSHLPLGLSPAAHAHGPGSSRQAEVQPQSPIAWSLARPCLVLVRTRRR